jgi:UDP-N-acetylmuramoyl-L-alanyl-D-glutamate--2,6-diaminopimelate ligase
MSSNPIMATHHRQPPSASTGPMSLRVLLSGCDVSPAAVPDVQVDDLTLDSREVGAGTVFIALPGTRTHGIGHARQAIDAGAAAIVWEPATGV